MAEPGTRVAPDGTVLTSADFIGREDVPLSDAELDLFRLKTLRWRRGLTVEPSVAARDYDLVLDRQIRELEAVVQAEREAADA